jgi:hypothetical protein
MSVFYLKLTLLILLQKKTIQEISYLDLILFWEIFSRNKIFKTLFINNIFFKMENF